MFVVLFIVLYNYMGNKLNIIVLFFPKFSLELDKVQNLSHNYLMRSKINILIRLPDCNN